FVAHDLRGAALEQLGQQLSFRKLSHCFSTGAHEAVEFCLHRLTCFLEAAVRLERLDARQGLDELLNHPQDVIASNHGLLKTLGESINSKVAQGQPPGDDHEDHKHKTAKHIQW